MNMNHPILIDNIGCLKDCIEVTSTLGQKDYTHQEPDLFPHGTFGAHLRHVVEFYFCFLEGIKEGKVDYAMRRRDLSIEESLEEGLSAIQRVVDSLENFNASDLDKPLQLKSESDHEDIWLSSCVLRELEYLIHHSVHHFALMSAQVRQMGRPIPHTFGVARSTLRHLASCAP